MNGNYTWNYDGTQGLHETEITSPVQTYLIFDAYPTFLISSDNTLARLRSISGYDRTDRRGPDRHNGQFNVVFCDGHVKSLNKQKFLDGAALEHRVE